MGNTQRRPQTLLESFDVETGEFDPQLYFIAKHYRRRRAAKRELEKINQNLNEIINEEDEETSVINSRRVRGRYERKDPPMYRCPVDGTLKVYRPENTPWFRDYVASPKTESRAFCKKFRRRFRMSYGSFLKHLTEVKEHPAFHQWKAGNVSNSGKKVVPIELLLLGVLRFLGRGWTTDDLEEQTMISQETHRRFIHLYLTWASTVFYKKKVNLPSPEGISESSYEYGIAGFPGCIGSQDATHVGMLRCQHRLKQYHDSFKLSTPSRTYNITVNHRRRILSSTRGHPGRWNDKSVVMYDYLSCGLRDGTLYNNIEFELLERCNSGVRARKYKGGWIIVDNGYLPWSTMVPPFKSYVSWPEFRFSKWLESMRKDVECTFGILKGRFRILKTGIPLHGIEVCDKVWYTCCALHNYLLEEDNLDNRWDVNRYMQLDGNHNDEDIMNVNDEQRQYDLINNMDNNHEGSTTQSETENTKDDHVAGSDDAASECLKVNKMRFADFRNKLVEHFDIQWKQNKIQWPSRTGMGNPPNLC